MRFRHAVLTNTCWLAALLIAPTAPADEGDVLRHLKSFFDTENATRRARIVELIESDPAYSRSTLSDWLHRAGLFEDYEPGQHRIQLPVPDTNKSMTVALRIPPGYDPQQAWPLIYALHGQGGTGEWIIGYYRQALGTAADRYVIAAPDGYTETRVDLGRPPLFQHRALLRGIKQLININSDRVYATGYSMGGHASWAQAVVMPEEFAGVMPIAGCLNLPRDFLADIFLQNLSNTYVFATWGAHDTLGANHQQSPTGGIAGANQRITAAADGLGLPVAWHEFPDGAHSNIDPPRDAMRKLLTRRRTQYPRTVDKRFRAPAESHCHWLEADDWVGNVLGGEGVIQVVFTAEENPQDPNDYQAAFIRTITGRVARLTGKVDGQKIAVARKKVRQVTIWVGDGMIDWDEPVEIYVSGKRIFNDRLEPDLYVCLLQAVRTYDFDRLRWSGVRYESGKKPLVVSRRTKFAPLPSQPH